MNPLLPSKVAVIGLGYVGLPLATHFGRAFPTLGFDINSKRVQALKQQRDDNGELSEKELSLPNLCFSSDPEDLVQADCFVISVPTPVDKVKRPDMTSLIEASRLVGRALGARHRRGSDSHLPPLVIYESTVYPGCTEEICLPVLERESRLRRHEDFKLGYSPERINPGDIEHTLDKVTKIVSGEDAETLTRVSALYETIVKAGVHRAPDIRTAEAAKVIENIQRDLNIALINELATLFHKLGIDTKEVLKAARTKWNFLPFEPGLVGGHCIPVDPYYLTNKAEEVGFHPEVILAGRRINDSMGVYVAREAIKLLIHSGNVVRNSNVLVLGVTFKENVRDVRNSKVLDIVRELAHHEIAVDVYDPLVDEETFAKIGLKGISDPFTAGRRYNAVVLAVPHRGFREKAAKDYLSLFNIGGNKGVFIDIKGAMGDRVLLNTLLYWTL